jgi:hypothetical protein
MSRRRPGRPLFAHIVVAAMVRSLPCGYDNQAASYADPASPDDDAARRLPTCPS